ncbi:MAG: hypothetical protein WA745_04915 [Methylovirgula sp.]
MPPGTEQIRGFGGRAPLGKFAFGAAISVLAILAFGTAQSAFWHTAPSPRARAWAGHLESPAGYPEVPSEPFTSASYTSGFDKAAVAPISQQREPQQAARDPNACPSDLNCAFRTAQISPPQRPPAAALPTAPVVPAPQTNPSGFAALTSRLLPPHVLLQPFIFVADTFTGLIKKL